MEISDNNQLCFMGSRLNFISYEKILQKSSDTGNDLYPIRVEYNSGSEELVTCTRKDLRFISMRNGRTNRIFSGLLRNQEDEIASFKSIH